jgi:hypothetical protein
LLWEVKEEAPSAKAKPQRFQIYPSWSWASLPTCTKVDYFPKNMIDVIPRVELLTSSLPPHDPGLPPKEAIRAGAKVKMVQIRGRAQELEHSSVSVSAVASWKPRSLEIWLNSIEVEGRLDYQADVDRLEAGNLKLYCLEVDRSAETGYCHAILLEKLPDPQTYCRVGVASWISKTTEQHSSDLVVEPEALTLV